MSGTLFIISSPSGGGKTSLVKALIESMPDLASSLSFTTRPKRLNEIDGLHYQFISEKTFFELKEKNEFLEWAYVFGYYYGTSKTWVKERLKQGLDLFLAIDWQGARQLREIFPQSKSIFIIPPSLQTLEARLRSREQDSLDVINQRMAKAKEEIAHYHEYDYVIVNEDFDTAARELGSIIMAERLRTAIQAQRYHDILSKLL